MRRVPRHGLRLRLPGTTYIERTAACSSHCVRWVPQLALISLTSTVPSKIAYPVAYYYDGVSQWQLVPTITAVYP